MHGEGERNVTMFGLTLIAMFLGSKANGKCTFLVLWSYRLSFVFFRSLPFGDATLKSEKKRPKKCAQPFSRDESGNSLPDLSSCYVVKEVLKNENMHQLSLILLFAPSFPRLFLLCLLIFVPSVKETRKMCQSFRFPIQIPVMLAVLVRRIQWTCALSLQTLW